jgi:hypothetical protein
MPIMEFFTTKQQEDRLDAIHKHDLSTHNARVSKGKYTAEAFVPHPERTFFVRNGVPYFGTECNQTASYKTYKLDEDYAEEIAAFQARHQNYAVKFKVPTTLAYDSKDGSTPAIMFAEDGDELHLIDMEKYDVVAG